MKGATVDYSFNITLTDEDYLAYNSFHLLKSPYGKKMMRSCRILITVLPLLVFGIMLGIAIGTNGFSITTAIGGGVIVALIILAQRSLEKSLVKSLKKQLDMMHKTGKPAYTPYSVLEFYADRLTETTDTARVEQKYEAVERVSILPDGTVYVHLNSVMAYIITADALGAADTREEFVAYLAQKCPQAAIERY